MTTGFDRIGRRFRSLAEVFVHYRWFRGRAAIRIAASVMASASAVNGARAMVVRP